MRHESDIVWKPNLVESSKCDDVPKLLPVFSVSIQHGRQNNSLDFLSDTEMPTSGDLKSGDIPVSNYTTTPPPPKKKEMRPPHHQIHLHALKSCNVHLNLITVGKREEDFRSLDLSKTS